MAKVLTQEWSKAIFIGIHNTMKTGGIIYNAQVGNAFLIERECTNSSRLSLLAINQAYGLMAQILKR